MGWSPRQWAQAAAWCERAQGVMPLPDLAGALAVRRLWELRVGSEPSDERLIVIHEWRWHELGRPCIQENAAWAARLFRAVALRTYP
jgi:hypothetical protein